MHFTRCFFIGSNKKTNAIIPYKNTGYNQNLMSRIESN